jgi:hypothetical protein
MTDVQPVPRTVEVSIGQVAALLTLCGAILGGGIWLGVLQSQARETSAVAADHEMRLRDLERSHLEYHGERLPHAKE